jgi:hypothetical protein
MSSRVLFWLSLCVLACFGCPSQEYTTSSGTISKLNYGPEENCQWIINSPGNIYMRFSKLDTEYNYDTIEIDQGQGTNAFILGAYSGFSFFWTYLQVRFFPWKRSMPSTTLLCILQAILLLRALGSSLTGNRRPSPLVPSVSGVSLLTH